ncbi:MAG TPA: ornithine carbamoyltransferase [Candidatus Polarisedimenticolia bacterium]|nr:ornithine carbamoyltransferase [Candidatus Polarisedimenticolia bacterium]
MRSFKGRDLITIRDFSTEEVAAILEKGADVKKDPKAYKKALDGKTLAMIFEKPSLRTRVTFEAGMTQLHGHAIFISPTDAALGKRESVADVARNLERWVDGIMARVFAHKVVEDLAAHARIPVINGLSDDFHPVQALSDLMTIKEKAGRFDTVKLAYVGDGNNVAHSLMLAAARTGLALSIATPAGYEPRADIVSWATQAGRETGAKIEVMRDPAQAVKDAQFVYTDVWASMGQEDQAESRRKIFAPYQVNRELMSKAGTDPFFLHCLPAHRGEEVTDDVADSPRSLIFEQAENRLHLQKAILVLLMGD